MDNRVRIKELFNRLDRRLFMEECQEFAHVDGPFPIGYGQTISQPSLVLAMTIMLDLKTDSKVLEIGTGSGFQTALLASGAKEVYTVERIKKLHDKAVKRLGEMGFDNISFKLGDGTMGWKEKAPFDRIMVTAAAIMVPPSLIAQLGEEGKMVIPIGNGRVQELTLIEKDSMGKLDTSVKEYVSFVPLVGKYE
ncbi:protein-L-isoaspartate(D-aspartate) O-methyltransferase [Alkalibacter saccharofermentans]|uniref:Protein-L-isoaspartate O-methyltransferase n=1 Tax=Alkalibacter saccharofermentans DSM 14828 TaxID=1120975 RepID=A0A1M4YK08_9FIRM|nr:protein-L-isoaspartate(D-aspartate) O-methyltransferase [Alkalibacter saccharofermentans]SHF06070.1 protein-L-isoaspartate(D-aspartate) O-methyltransferase [Alkalibacter saccharofermentans DSM 14828]